jgi:hypothetical protein
MGAMVSLNVTGRSGTVRRAVPPGGLRIGGMGLDGSMLTITAALSILTGLLFGLAPALAAIRPNFAGSLNESFRGTGAQRAGSDGPGLVGGRVLRLVVIGLLAGLGGALAFARLIATQLWGVTPTDPATYVVVSLMVACVALLASYTPLRRALDVDPTVALRYE